MNILKRLKQWINKAFSTESCGHPFVSEECKRVLEEVNVIVNGKHTHVSLSLFEQVSNALTTLGYPCRKIRYSDYTIYFSIESIEHYAVVEYVLNYYKAMGILIKIIKPTEEWRYGQWYIE